MYYFIFRYTISQIHGRYFVCYLSFLFPDEGTGFELAPPTDAFIPPDWEQMWARIAAYPLVRRGFGLNWLKRGILAMNAATTNTVFVGTNATITRVYGTWAFGNIIFIWISSNSRKDISTNHDANAIKVILNGLWVIHFKSSKTKSFQHILVNGHTVWYHFYGN